MSAERSDNAGIVRTTVSIPIDEYERLRSIAEQKRVSIAWVVRDAIAQYLLLVRRKDEEEQI